MPDVVNVTLNSPSNHKLQNLRRFEVDFFFCLTCNMMEMDNNDGRSNELNVEQNPNGTLIV